MTTSMTMTMDIKRRNEVGVVEGRVREEDLRFIDTMDELRLFLAVKQDGHLKMTKNSFGFLGLSLSSSPQTEHTHNPKLFLA